MQVKQSTRVTRESGGNELPSLNCSKTITIVNGAFYYKKSWRERTEKTTSYIEKRRCKNKSTVSLTVQLGDR